MSKRARDEENEDANDGGAKDDSDADDDDYDPDADADEAAELEADIAEEAAEKESTANDATSWASEITETIRARRVDDLWASMKAEERAEPLKVSAAAALRKSKTSSGASRKARKLERKARKVLTGVFGSSTLAKDLIAKAAVKGKTGSSSSSSSSKSGSSSGSSKKKTRIEAPKSLNITRAVTVTETAKFAGQTVIVTKKVLGGNDREAASSSSSSSGLDAALSAITGPAKLNTVTKSSADWEAFKEASGAAKDDLEQAARNGFLAKKEFLERCDLRAFEKEKDQRTTMRDKK